MSLNNEMVKLAYEAGYRVLQNGDIVNRQGRLIGTQETLSGYLRVGFRRRKLAINSGFLVHRLAAYCKYGDQLFEPSLVVRHLDGDPTNNSWANIALGTQSQNMFDIDIDVRIERSLSAAKARRRFTDEEVAQMRLERSQGAKLADLCRKYNASKGTLSPILSGKLYQGGVA